MLRNTHIAYRQQAAVKLRGLERVLVLTLCVAFILPCLPLMAARQDPQGYEGPDVYIDPELIVPVDSAALEGDLVAGPDTVLTVVESPYGLEGKRVFNPDPNRAVWLSALFPGLGQIYNRRYWKLPIIVGGFMGLGYATSWNNNQYQDYTQAYRDLLDSDPNSNSYMNFFPPNTNEDSLDKTWLTSLMKSRKDYYRRNRDLCIICVVALYLVCMLDAYVDASLSHFDLSPDLSLDVQPAMMRVPRDPKPALGMSWALNF